jgi:glycosyltransferase involved in cell wall biosynthesis
MKVPDFATFLKKISVNMKMHFPKFFDMRFPGLTRISFTATISGSSALWQLNLLGSGSGEEKERCLGLAKELGEKVRVYGALSQNGLAKIMRHSHILVLPSFYEGLPLVILEALASGCRIVATDLPGTTELLGDYDTDFITMVRTPRLRFSDQPYREDENVFEKNLEKAIRQQIKAASKDGQIDLSPIQDKLEAYTWAGIFKKVREVYLSCLI